MLRHASSLRGFATMDGEMDFSSVEEILSDLHQNEINGGLSWFSDVLGDRLNGYKAGASVRSLNEAAEWLVEKAVRFYPQSNFARKYRVPDAFLARLQAAEVAETETPDENAIAEDDAADLAVVDGV
jgi:hypothetical protein